MTPIQWIVLSLLCGLRPAIWAAEPLAVNTPNQASPISYATQVSEFIDAKCVACHNQALAENKLVMEDVAAMLKGGKRGPSMIPGNAEKSLLFQMAAHRVEPVMPPVAKKDLKPLTSDELGLLKLWIDQGAKDDSAEHTRETKPLELGSLPAGVHPIVAVDMTTDGTQVAAGRANTVQVYDVTSGMEIISLGGHSDIIQSVRYSPDGSKLAVGSYKVVSVWNAPTGRLSGSIEVEGAHVSALGIYRDTGKILTAGNGKLALWEQDLKDASKYKHLVASQVFASAIHCVALSPRGQQIAIGLDDSTIALFRSEITAEPRLCFTGMGSIKDLVFVDDSHLVMVSEARSAALYTLTANGLDIRKEPLVLNGHGGVNAVAATADGKLTATAGVDGTVRFYHTFDGKLTRVLQTNQSEILALAFSLDGRQLLTSSVDQTTSLFDVATGERRLTLDLHRPGVTKLAFSPSGDRIATAGADGAIKIWESANGRPVIAFGEPNPERSPPSGITALSFLTETRLVAASATGQPRIWSFAGTWSELRTFDQHTGRVLALDFHPDGSLLATGGGEPSRTGEIKVWELNKGMLVRQFETLHTDTVFGLKFSPDGSKLASAGADKFLKVVEVAGGKELRSFEGHTNHVLAVDWKSDGKQLITGGGDNVLKLWDYETSAQVRTMIGAGKQLTALRWVPGTNKVVGASGDSNVRLWAADNGNVVRTFSGVDDYVFGVAVSADAKTVAAGGANGILFVWDGDNGKVIRKFDRAASNTAPP